MYLTVLFVIVIYQQLHPRLFGKAIATPEMFQVCRFCSCQDEALLIPLEDILDFGLAFQDVSIVTGIEINEENIASYAMCLECTTKLKSSVSFRNACLSNESLFQELFAVLAASVKELRAKIIDTIEIADSSDESQNDDLDALDGCFANYVESPESNEENSLNDQFFEDTSNEETAQTIDTAEEVFSYSANYIPPGETVFFEDVDKHKIDWYTSLNPSAPPPVRCVREPGKRKCPLCDICGKIVRHLPSHVVIHKEESTYSCPYCPTKTKQRNNLQVHIKTVHMKTVMKTCNICGKGFIHHKTYRYHMLNHQGEGKTFESVDCSKTFSNSIYIRDHIYRLHNAEKQIHMRDLKQRIRRRVNFNESEIGHQ
ncbi:zinc finger protein 430-like isoform X7 [Anopheles funestus]